MADQLINGFNFEQASDQALIGLNFEEVNAYPVIHGVSFEADNNNFNCVITDTLGNLISGATVVISTALDSLTYASDSNGDVEGLIRPNVNTTLSVSAHGYKTYSQKFELDSGDLITWFVTLHRVVHVISASGNILTSHNPTNEDNQIYE